MNYRLIFFLQAGLIVTALAWTRHLVEVDNSKEKRELVAPPKDIVYFTAGHREIVADILWIRSIQDFDYCEKQLAKHLCEKNSWLYQMLEVITDLSPNFRMAYSAGAMALTIIISDIEGASKFFDKAVAQFPKDWNILYKAAYHSIYEEHNSEKAARLMESAARNGAPDWTYALASRLYTNAGKRELAEGLIRQLEDSGKDQELAEKLRERIDRPDAGEIKIQQPDPQGK